MTVGLTEVALMPEKVTLLSLCIYINIHINMHVCKHHPLKNTLNNLVLVFWLFLLLKKITHVWMDMAILGSHLAKVCPYDFKIRHRIDVFECLWKSSGLTHDTPVATVECRVCHFDPKLQWTNATCEIQPCFGSCAFLHVWCTRLAQRGSGCLYKITWT